MPPPKPANRLAYRVPPVKYFSIRHGAALMVGTNPGPGGDDFSRNWKQMNKAGRILPAHDMAARYFLFGEMGCEQIDAKSAAKMAVELGGSLEMLVTGVRWQRSRSTPVARKGAKAGSPRKPAIGPRANRPNFRPGKSA